VQWCIIYSHCQKCSVLCSGVLYTVIVMGVLYTVIVGGECVHVNCWKLNDVSKECVTIFKIELWVKQETSAYSLLLALVCCIASHSMVKMESTCSSETSVVWQKIKLFRICSISAMNQLLEDASRLSFFVYFAVEYETLWHLERGINLSGSRVLFALLSSDAVPSGSCWKVSVAVSGLSHFARICE
jgi:hypothetical protein